MVTRWLLALTIATSVAACDDDEESEPLKSTCIESTRAPAGADERIPLGTPNEWVDKLAELRAGPLTWSDTPDAGTRSSPLEIRIAADVTTAQRIKQERVGGRAACPDLLEMRAALNFVTGDGTFNETFPGVVIVDKYSTGAAVSYVAQLPLADVKGSFRAMMGLPPSLDTLNVTLVKDAPATLTRGNVQLFAKELDLDAGFQSALIATWGD